MDKPKPVAIACFVGLLRQGATLTDINLLSVECGLSDHTGQDTPIKAGYF